MIPIPYPDTTIYVVGIILTWFVGGFLTVYFLYKFESWWCLSPIIPMIVIFILLSSQMYEMTDNWEKNISVQIELANCDDLKSLYTQYNSSRFKEKIKSKYIFDCVADKNSLEMLQ